MMMFVVSLLACHVVGVAVVVVGLGVPPSLSAKSSFHKFYLSQQYVNYRIIDRE